MTVHSRGARRALAAVCSTAVVAAGAAFFAAPASASGTTIGFFPSTTAASIVNVDPTTGANNPTLTYGVKLTGNSDGFPLYAQVVSGPGDLYVERVAAATINPLANPTATA